MVFSMESTLKIPVQNKKRSAFQVNSVYLIQLLIQKYFLSMSHAPALKHLKEATV